ncbi:TIGR04150 pseudo-rSAM protein [uncultured Parabacteroides sp.]|uniref:TIGR04150 pseudo-rSAM protein n=1 Tax=uncultured Parabacteroides sp. TaxID=512312 RepID=UPI0025D44889|nr:TIGR04150 pseudo-rSAM protein [uncultured Parabacteroides sp.]
MNTYWLYLEPYTMVFSEKEKSLIYNTLSSEYLQIPNSGKAYSILQRILSSPDIYLLKIEEDELFEKEVIAFVKNLQSKFLGEYIACHMTTRKPVILYPKLKLLRSVKNMETMGKDILAYLQKIVIQITGKCTCQCSVCSYAYKQITVCNRLCDKELDLDILLQLITIIRNTSAKSIDIIGGNPFFYSSFEKMLEVIKLTPMLQFNIKCFSEHIITLTDCKVLSLLKNIPNIHLQIQYVGNVFIDYLQELQMRLENCGVRYGIEFLISSEEQYSQAIDICKALSFSQYEMIVLLNEKNMDFAKQMYWDEEDILSLNSSKKDIYRRQSINTFDFGKIIVLANGDVYSNMNFDSLGNIYKEDISAILLKELEEGKSWFRVRNNIPCNDCVYQWFCPSPSNYEIVAGRLNFCSIK